MPEIAIAQIEAREAAQHHEVAFERRFVEAVQRLELSDLLGVHARVGAHAERQALLRAFAQIMQRLLHRPARHELDHDEGQRQYAEERRDHQ
jgi:hypothetical protein